MVDDRSSRCRMARSRSQQEFHFRVITKKVATFELAVADTVFENVPGLIVMLSRAAANPVETKWSRPASWEFNACSRAGAGKNSVACTGTRPPFVRIRSTPIPVIIKHDNTQKQREIDHDLPSSGRRLTKGFEMICGRISADQARSGASRNHLAWAAYIQRPMANTG